MIRKLSLAASLLTLLACTPQEAEQAAPPVKEPVDQIDLIVVGDHVVTMNDAATVHTDAAIAIDDGVIVAIGPAAEINAEYSARDTLAGKNRIVMPGLVNGHSHAAMTLLRGVADDLALMEWLNDYMFPAEVQFVDAEFGGVLGTIPTTVSQGDGP